MSDADNIGHHTEVLETTAQILLMIYSMKKSMDKDRVVKSLESIKPHLVNKIGAMYDYVCSWSGGETPYYLRNTDAFSKTLKRRREVPSSLFAVLAKAQFSQGPEVINAMLKATLCASNKWIKSGNVASIFTSSDVTLMQGNLKFNCKQAVNIIRLAKECLDAVNAPPADVDPSEHKRVLSASDEAKILGDLEVDVVMFVFKKKAAYE